MTTTTAETVSRRLRFRRRVRDLKAGLRGVLAPLSVGWGDTKRSFADGGDRLRAGLRDWPPEVRLLLLAIPLVVLLALPVLPFVSPFYKTVLVDRVAFYVLLALGLNVVVGFAGLLDLGYVAFYAIGAYVAAYFTGSMPVAPPFVLDPFLTFPFAILITMLFGVLLGLPTLRLRGDYLAIVTLGFHEIVRITLLNVEGITNGARGVNAIPQFELPFADPAVVNYVVALAAVGVLLAGIGAYQLYRGRRDGGRSRGAGLLLVVGGVALTGASPALGLPFANLAERFVDFGLDPVPYYYLSIAICALMVFIVRRLSDSRVGRAWVAIREDEIAAEAMGIPTLKMKVWAFAIGASTAGFAGVMLAVKTSFISPQNFVLLQSIIVLAMVVFGGMGSIVGAIVGATAIGFTTEALRDFDAVPFLEVFIALGVVVAVYGLLVASRVVSNRAGPVYGWWLVAIGVLLAALSPVLRLPFRAIAQNPDPWRLFLLGLILVVVMIARPEGLIPSRRRAAELHGETTAAEAKLTDAGEQPTTDEAPLAGGAQ